MLLLITDAEGYSKNSYLSPPNEFGDGTMKWFTSVWTDGSLDVCEENLDLF